MPEGSGGSDRGQAGPVHQVLPRGRHGRKPERRGLADPGHTGPDFSGPGRTGRGRNRPGFTGPGRTGPGRNRPDFTGADLTRADFTRASFTGACFHRPGPTGRRPRMLLAQARTVLTSARPPDESEARIQ
ncbi:pentapeptide repeat-containing protein [Sphaerimonospora mesophila]|uniref:pentapeptide repeat-containing protein n=1 Tax=Sphaerimonospora mesophila TaxID=37483 RepID=UPI00128EA47C